MIQASGANHDPSLDDLLSAVRPKLIGTMRRLRIPVEDAEDLIQEVLMQFIRKRDTIHDPEPWLVGAMRNQCRYYKRSRSRQLHVAVDEAILEVFAQPEAPPQEKIVMRRNLERLVSGLKERCQKLLSLRYQLGYDVREIAERMDYQPSSIDKVTRRCLDALSRRLVAAGRRRP